MSGGIFLERRQLRGIAAGTTPILLVDLVTENKLARDTAPRGGSPGLAAFDICRISLPPSSDCQAPLASPAIAWIEPLTLVAPRRAQTNC